MIEINLLPWREMHRRRLRFKILWSGALALLLLLLAANAPHSLPAPPRIASIPVDHSSIEHTEQKLRQIKFVGFVRQGERAWGLLLFANGETHEVSVGSIIAGTDAHIIHVNQQQITISYGHKNIYTLAMSN